MNKYQLILETALKLFVTNGFHGTATSKIAQEAGVANGSLFNYFATKEILIVAIYNTILKKMDNYIIQNSTSHSVSKESFRSLYVASIFWNMENIIEFKYLQQFYNSPYFKSELTQIPKQDEHPLYVLIQNGINVVLLKPMPAALIYCLFSSQIKGLCDYLISTNSSKIEIDEVVKETFELLWKMIED